MQPSEIRQYINAALADPSHTEVPDFAPGGDAQVILDEIWKVSANFHMRNRWPMYGFPIVQVLDSPALPNAASNSSFGIYRNQLRRLSLKMATKHDKFPRLLILQGVECTDAQQHGAGGFADVFCGTYHGSKVGLKRLRMYLMMSPTQREALKKVRYLSIRRAK